ncbi:MAG TPA: hypothetical protein VJQ77_05875 [Novosphingobium sp.]|nr:hypothetical protein [Novosphingobium sp.]
MADTATDPWIGKYVVVRTRDAGVHAGLLKSRLGRECELQDSRRLWRWRVNGNKGITLSDVAVHGLDKRDTRVGSPVSILLTEDCEIIECTPEAAENIAQFPTYEPR